MSEESITTIIIEATTSENLFSLTVRVDGEEVSTVEAVGILEMAKMQFVANKSDEAFYASLPRETE